MNCAKTGVENPFSGLIGQEYEAWKRISPAAVEISGRVAECVAAWQSPAAHGPLNVLEIGCGTGVTSAALLSARNDLSLRSLDSAPAMLQQAHANLEEWRSTGRLELVETDALSGLRATAADSVDVVASCYTLHNFPDPYRAEVLGEIRRVLKPGGFFVNGDRYALDDVREHTGLTQEEVAHYFRVFAGMERYDLLEQWIVHLFNDESPDHIMRLSPALTAIAAAGLERVDVVYRNGINAVVSAEKPR